MGTIRPKRRKKGITAPLLKNVFAKTRERKREGGQLSNWGDWRIGG